MASNASIIEMSDLDDSITEFAINSGSDQESDDETMIPSETSSADDSSSSDSDQIKRKQISKMKFVV